MVNTDRNGHLLSHEYRPWQGEIQTTLLLRERESAIFRNKLLDKLSKPKRSYPQKYNMSNTDGLSRVCACVCVCVCMHVTDNYN